MKTQLVLIALLMTLLQNVAISGIEQIQICRPGQACENVTVITDDPVSILDDPIIPNGR